jgi:hypothetical protein
VTEGQEVLDLVFYLEAVNPDRLAAELIAVLGPAFIEIVIGGGPREVHVRVKGDVADDVVARAWAVVENHQPYEPEEPPPPEPPPAPGPGNGLIDLVYGVDQVNVDLLHEELKAALGNSLAGISMAPGAVRVHVRYDIGAMEQERVEPVVRAHDPGKRTAAQQAQTARLALIQALHKEWTAWSAEDKDSFLRLLAAEMDILPIG